MARIRSSKPEWWRKAKWCALPRDIRFTYKGIWEVMCDDAGRFIADARLIKGDVWPLDDDITTKKLEHWLQQLARVSVTDPEGRRVPAVVLYDVDGVRYGFLPAFRKHQKISHPSPSKLPPPPGPTPARFANDSGTAPELLRHEAEAERDVDWEEDLEAEREAPTPIPDPDPLDLAEQPAPPAPRVVLPEAARQFLERFYGLATDKRRLDVTDQVYRTLDPTVGGARLNRGVYVKARDAAHLAACCASVMDDPPREIDKAIVILLHKLQDPPPGPSVAEQRVVAEQSRVALEERYHAEAKRAGIRWANEHPEAYRAIVEQAEAEFRGASGLVGKMAREARLAQRCAEEAGFPSFESWSAQHEPRRASA